VSTIFRNVHCVGWWIQCNTLALITPHPSTDRCCKSFTVLCLDSIRSILNTIILQHLISNSQHTRGVKYSHPVLVTRMCRNFLPDEEFLAYDRVFVASERITSAYNSCLHSVWTPTFILEDVPAYFSSEEQIEEDEEPEFWNQPPPTYTRFFMFPFGKAWRRILGDRFGSVGRWRSRLLGQTELRKDWDVHNRPIRALQPDQVVIRGDIVPYHFMYFCIHVIYWGQCMR